MKRGSRESLLVKTFGIIVHLMPAKRALDFSGIDAMSRTPKRSRLRFDDATSPTAISGSVSRPRGVMELGEGVGTSDCKKQTVFDNTGERTYEPLADPQVNSPNYFFNNALIVLPNLLDEIRQGSEINERERRIINLRGFHIKANLLNQQVGHAKECHMALLVPNGNLLPGQVSTDFFRHYRTERARDFTEPDANTTNRISPMEIMMNPINTDRYKVLLHKTVNLGRAGSGSAAPHNNEGTESNYRSVQWWVPIDRQIRYNSTTQVESDQVYFVVWFAQPFAFPYTDPNATTNPLGVTNLQQWVGGTTPTNFMNLQIVGYFRDPRST